MYEFDDKITAPYFGFCTADNYYATQSSNQFLGGASLSRACSSRPKTIRSFPSRYSTSPAIRGNPNIELLAVEHGGHLGFLSNTFPRFWVDRVILHWLEGLQGSKA